MRQAKETDLAAALVKMREIVDDPAVRVACESDDINMRRRAAMVVLGELITFADEAGGLPDPAYSLINELLQSMADAIAGKNAPLLQRDAESPPGSHSATDHIRQATAQVCVDLFQREGLSHDASYREVARLFAAAGIRGCGFDALKKLQSRMVGKGHAEFPAFAHYGTATEFARTVAQDRAAQGLSTTAKTIAKHLVSTFAAELQVRRK